MFLEELRSHMDMTSSDRGVIKLKESQVHYRDMSLLTPHLNESTCSVQNFKLFGYKNVCCLTEVCICSSCDVIHNELSRKGN